MKNQNYQSLVETLQYWEDYNIIYQNEKTINKETLFNITHLLASIFSPGEFYYLVMDFNKTEIASVSTSFHKIMGYEEMLDVAMFFEMLHPDDAAVFSMREKAICDFYWTRIPEEKMLFYKTSYVVRARHADGSYRKLHIQAIPLKFSSNRMFQYVLHVHSDVTYLNIPVDNRISFIGLNGEPSYYSLGFEQDNFLMPKKELALTKREKQVVGFLAEGLASKQIATELSITKNTVDTHRRNLLKKTKTKNTLELTALCIREGLI